MLDRLPLTIDQGELMRIAILRRPYVSAIVLRVAIGVLMCLAVLTLQLLLGDGELGCCRFLE